MKKKHTFSILVSSSGDFRVEKFRLSHFIVNAVCFVSVKNRIQSMSVHDVPQRDTTADFHFFFSGKIFHCKHERECEQESKIGKHEEEHERTYFLFKINVHLLLIKIAVDGNLWRNFFYVRFNFLQTFFFCVFIWSCTCRRLVGKKNIFCVFSVK